MAEMARVVYTAIAVIFLSLTAKELFQGAELSGQSTKEIPKMKLARFAGPTLQFEFWKVFDQYVDIIKERYPDLILQGDNYPPPTYKMYLAQFLGIAKFILIIMIVSGFNPFSSLGTATPSFYNWFLENKMYACMMIFFLSNALEGHLVSTGAFEISFNGVPVWSKLETGRIPSPAEIFQIIDSNLQFSGSS